MKKKLLIFLILAIVSVFSIVGFRVIKTKNTLEKIDNPLFSDGSKVMDEEVEVKNVEEKNNDENIDGMDQEQVWQEEKYSGTDNGVSNGSNSNVLNSSSNQNSFQSSSKDNSKNDSTSNTQSNSQASSESISDSNNDDNSVDLEHPDYYIHRGIIDCEESSGCLEKSVRIKLDYKKVIDYSNFVEVYAKNGSILGYFIEYVFKEYTYSSYDECNNVGTQIKNVLSNRITGYVCSVNGTLKINTVY